MLYRFDYHKISFKTLHRVSDMTEEKPKEKKKYVKPEIKEKGSLGDKLSLDGFDVGL